MCFEIVHNTTYTFSDSVYLEPHIVRLRPHCSASQRVLAFDLDVEPSPAGRSESNDLGGVTTTLWFDGSTDRLAIRAKSRVETIRDNPFDFIFTDPATATLPSTYARELQTSLKPFLRRNRAAVEVNAYAEETARDSNHDTQAFLTKLAARIYDEFDKGVREHGKAWPASKTLRARRGACRDLAVLFVDACRSQGLAARFVSGYIGVRDVPHRHMHAWAEVYLPGAGWRGFDPTSGLAVGNDHVSVAFAALPRNVAPITGSFRRTGATASVAYRISIREIT